jgi:aminomuconate-semialdehyde/2-hydroxymuconate-6-semialdehyde dehydrogenase
LCGSRIYVQKGIYDKWLAAFVQKVKEMKVGDPKAADTNCGALVSKDHMSKVRYYIEKAVIDGGKIEIGGLDAPEGLPEANKDGYFVRPTVITGLAHSSCVVKEEIFGPVVTIIPFETDEEAIALANDVEYGLACTIWTSKSSRVHRVAHAIDAGTVWVNTWMLRDLRVPFGGMKASGVGREGGTHSIDCYTEQKTTVIRHDLD